MLYRIINNLNKELSANHINMTIVRQNDFVAYGVIHNGNEFFSISIRENLIKISEEFYFRQADEITYREVLSFTHQGEIEFIRKSIQKIFTLKNF